MWIKVDNDVHVHINAAMVTQIEPKGEHDIIITLACGTRHKLSMDCNEFLASMGCGFVKEHEAA